jgi:hypothetical protein
LRILYSTTACGRARYKCRETRITGDRQRMSVAIAGRRSRSTRSNAKEDVGDSCLSHSHALAERARVSWNSRFIGKGPETASLRHTERGVTTPVSHNPRLRRLTACTSNFVNGPFSCSRCDDGSITCVSACLDSRAKSRVLASLGHTVKK